MDPGAVCVYQSANQTLPLLVPAACSPCSLRSLTAGLCRSQTTAFAAACQNDVCLRAMVACPQGMLGDIRATKSLQYTNAVQSIGCVSQPSLPVLQPGCHVHRVVVHMSGMSMQAVLTSVQACGVTWSQVQWEAPCTVPPRLSAGTASLPSAQQPAGQPARHCPGRGLQFPPVSAARNYQMLTQLLKTTEQS